MPRRRKTPPDGRVNSGGARQGAPGRAYANRSDLNGPKLPVSAGPSAEYGQRARLERSQAAVPMASGPTPPPGQSAAAAPPPAAGPRAGALPFDRPSERPGEPLTTGIAGGPGAGPEALAMTNRPDPELEALRPYLPTLELLASQPNASPSARMFVRRLRGSMPPPGGGG